MNTTNRSPNEIREAVRQHYAEVASTNAACGCGPGCCSPSAKAVASLDIGYTSDDLRTLPEGADMGLGCGTPLAFAALQEGEVVLDLGSGGGIDCLLGARQVGSSGQVIGVDMTPEMVRKARDNAERVQVKNVEFRLGEIERLPVADRSVDVIVSNCVINLSPDKRAVFAEAFRVLRPGGRVAISDIVASAPIPEAVKSDPQALSGCIAGAPSVDEIATHLRAAGFVEIAVRIDERSRSFIKDWAPGSGAEGDVASAQITARRPRGGGCCGTTSESSCC
jgi:SAM-dependent methyltransferase